MKLCSQHATGRFVASRTWAGFCCTGARQEVEIDGHTYAARDQAAYDSARTAWLEERGHGVIRFYAEEVERNLEGVLEMMRGACEAGEAGGNCSDGDCG